MAERVGQGRQRCTLGQPCQLPSTATPLRHTRETPRSATEAALAGGAGSRTRVSAPLRAPRPPGAYTSLAGVERAVRSVKTVALSGRPMGPRVAERGRAQVCLWRRA